MPKKSAGLLVYHFDENKVLKVLLVHPGGPLYAKKSDGVWSIPKGEYEDNEDALHAAQREFTEETGNLITTDDFTPLTTIKLKSGKLITAWAAEQYFATPFIHSSLFEMVWPPKSGKLQIFPETDKADWFTVAEARLKLYESQHPFLDKLLETVASKNQ